MEDLTQNRVQKGISQTSSKTCHGTRAMIVSAYSYAQVPYPKYKYNDLIIQLNKDI